MAGERAAYISLINSWNPYPNPSCAFKRGGADALRVHRIVVLPKYRSRGIGEWLMASVCRRFVRKGRAVLLSTRSTEASRKFKQYSCLQFTGEIEGLSKFVFIGEALHDMHSGRSWEFVCLKSCKHCRAASRQKALVCYCCGKSNFATPQYPGQWLPRGNLPPDSKFSAKRRAETSACDLPDRPAKKISRVNQRTTVTTRASSDTRSTVNSAGSTVNSAGTTVNSATKSWRAFANAHVPVGASLKLRLRPSDTVRMMENGNMLYDQRVFHSPSGVAAHARRLCKRNLICNG